LVSRAIPAAMKRSSACVAARWKSILIMLKPGRLSPWRKCACVLPWVQAEVAMAAWRPLNELFLNPDLAEAHAVKARILSEENRNDEASRGIEIALQLDPESHQVNRSAAVLRFR